MLTVRNRNTNLAEDVLGNGKGAVATESTPRYQNLGLLIDADEVAASAVVWSPQWYDDIAWIKSQIWFSQADQLYTIAYMPRDEALFESGFSVGPIGDLSSISEAMWRVTHLSGGNANPGYGCRYRMQNKSDSATTYMRLRVQLIG